MSATIGPNRRVYVFADESGGVDWTGGRGCSRYWILATVTLTNCNLGHILLNRRREMAWRGIGLNEEWHASESSRDIQKAVFELLSEADFLADLTIFEKSKVPDIYRSSLAKFYEFAWYWHFARLAPDLVQRDDELFVVSASIGTKQVRRACFDAVSRAIQLNAPGITHRVAHWRDDSDPCLIIPDFVAWAVFRYREWMSPAFYRQIQPKIRSELDFFAEYGPKIKDGRS